MFLDASHSNAFYDIMNRKLSIPLENPILHLDNTFKTEPVAMHYGLSNDEVIHTLYKYHNNCMVSVDYIDVIKDDIVNLKPLDKKQMEYVFHLNTEEKNEIIILFNQSIETFSQYIDQLCSIYDDKLPQTLK